MISFLFEDLFSTVKSLMGLIIRQDVSSIIVNGRQLQKFDFTKEENPLPLKSIRIGFAVERNTELRRKDVLSLNEVKRFLKDYRAIIIGILEKTFERSLDLLFWKQLVTSIQSQSFQNQQPIFFNR